MLFIFIILISSVLIFYIFQNTKFKISFSSNRLKLKPISKGVLKFALSFLFLATGSAFTYYKIGNPFIDINKLNHVWSRRQMKFLSIVHKKWVS